MGEYVLVDTDVVSFVFKGHSLAQVYEEILEGRTLVPIIHGGG